MRLSTKAVVLATFLALSAGGAYAAETAAMDCCKKCECCKDKHAADNKADQPAAEHKH